MGRYLLKPQNSKKTHRLRGEVLIGRTRGALRFVNDKRMSSQHCRLHVTGEGVFVEDLKSSNGTFVNGTKLEPGSKLSLQPGDHLTAGGQTFALEYDPKEPRSVPFEWFFLIAAVGCMAFAFIPGPSRAPRPRVPAAVPVAPDDPLLTSLRFAEDDFKNLATNYARLMDSVIIDRSPRSAAVTDIEGRFKEQFRRTLDEAGKLQATDNDGKELIRLYARKVSLLRDHSVAMATFWKDGKLEDFKKSIAIMKDYKATALRLGELTDRRAARRAGPTSP